MSLDPNPSNLVVLRGTVAAHPVHRELPSGAVVVQFDVRTRLGDADAPHRASVPVAWRDPSASALRPVVAGCDVVVVGSVVRRFFRVGGATQSRTEVVPAAVVPLRRTKTVDAVIRAAAGALTVG